MRSVRTFLSEYLPAGSARRWIASGFYRNPLIFAAALMSSLNATKKLTGSFFPVQVRISCGQKFTVNCAKGATARLSGVIFVANWGGANNPSSISCGSRAKLEISGDFDIGPGVHISIAEDAILLLGGRDTSSASGITCNTRIMVEERVEIGADTIVAWDVFISDSDWHNIKGARRCSPVSIGSKVWISHGVSVLKGVSIPSGCIVGARSLVTGGKFTERSLIAGAPAMVCKENIEWSR